MTYFRVIVVAVALAVVLYLLAQLRARRIRERYVWLWLILLAGVGVVALVPGLMSQLAEVLGFQISSNLVLTAAAIVTFLVTVILSAAVSDLQMSVRTLTEEIAFLRCEVDQLRADAAPATPPASEPAPEQPEQPEQPDQPEEP